MQNISSNKILIVSNDKGALNTLTLILSDIYDLIKTNDEKQAFDILKNNHTNICLLLIDSKLPQISSKESTSKIKEAYPHIKIILLAEYSNSTDSRKKIIDHTISNCVARPFIPEEILKIIEKNFSSLLSM